MNLLQSINRFLNFYKNTISSKKNFFRIENTKENIKLVYLFLKNSFIIRYNLESKSNTLKIILRSKKKNLNLENLTITNLLHNNKNIYCSYKKINLYYNNIISSNPNVLIFVNTSKGILTHKEMIELKLNGNVLFYIC